MIFNFKRQSAATLSVFCLMAATLNACGDDEKSNPAPKPECTTNADCKDRTDNKTECNTLEGLCVKPQKVSECITDADCKNRTDNKTECDSDQAVCVEPKQHDLCGNEQIDGDEQCDKNNFNQKTCADYGSYVSGTLICTNTCIVDSSKCLICTPEDTSQCKANQICINNQCVDEQHEIKCGDGLREGDEECDELDFGDATCANDSRFVGGSLSCVNCKIDRSQCVECTSADSSKCTNNKICITGSCVEETVKCGNGRIDAGEECDGAALPSIYCADATDYVLFSGLVYCNKDCTLNLSNCHQCDNDLDCTYYITTGPSECRAEACYEVEPEPEAPADVVISQIYPGGGNQNSTFGVRYIELFNRDEKDAVLDGWSIQYSSKDGKSISRSCNLPVNAVIPSKSYYLIALSGNSQTLPVSADADCSELSTAQSNGKIFLVSSTSKLTTGKPSDDMIIDGVGYGTADWGHLGSPMRSLTAQTAGFRKNGGCVDTGDNSADFFTTAPNPRNSKSPKNYCDTIMPECGNGVLDEGEACDNKLFINNETSCASLDPQYISGTVSCSNSCTLDYSQCQVPRCGDGTLSGTELCDKTAFVGNKTTCAAWDSQYSDGNVKCTNDCNIDYTDCQTPCGNGKLNEGEECDKDVFADDKLTCSAWNSKYSAGDVTCSSDCTVEYANCIESVEICDNGIDDNDNGLIDCADPDCNSQCDDHGCLKTQVWLDNYQLCAYPISNAEEFNNVAQKWKEQGAAAYPANAPKRLAFVLLDDIEFNQDNIELGDIYNNFNALFYGNDKTIKGEIDNYLVNYASNLQFDNVKLELKAKRLFGDVKVQMNNVIANIESEKAIIASGEGTFNNLNIRANIENGQAGFIAKAPSAVKITNSAFNINANLPVHDYNFGLLISNAEDITLDNVTIKGSLNVTTGVKIVSVGIIAGIANKLNASNVKLTVNRLAVKANYATTLNIGGLVGNIKKTSKLDRIEFTDYLLFDAPVSSAIASEANGLVVTNSKIMTNATYLVGQSISNSFFANNQIQCNITYTSGMYAKEPDSLLFTPNFTGNIFIGNRLSALKGTSSGSNRFESIFYDYPNAYDTKDIQFSSSDIHNTVTWTAANYSTDYLNKITTKFKDTLPSGSYLHWSGYELKFNDTNPVIIE